MTAAKEEANDHVLWSGKVKIRLATSTSMFPDVPIDR